MDWKSFEMAEVGKVFAPRGLIVHLAGEDEDTASDLADYTDAQRATLALFVDNEQALFDALCDALEADVNKREEEARRWARRQGEQHREADALIYGEEIEEDEVDDEVRELFDDPEDDDDGDDEDELDDDEDEPIHSRFQITRLVILEDTLGFLGHADWEEEHGLGVIMKGFDVQEIGYQDLLL